MKVRFYCDIPSQGVRLVDNNSWPLSATTTPTYSVCKGFTRMAFDVDLPPNLALEPYDVLAPRTEAKIVESGSD